MTKGPLLQQIMDELPEERRKEIKARAGALIEEYRTLQQVREGIGLIPPSEEEQLNLAPPNISRLERNKDVKLSTLQNYVEALGGHVNVTIELPDQPPLSLELGDFLDAPSDKVLPVM